MATRISEKLDPVWNRRRFVQASASALAAGAMGCGKDPAPPPGPSVLDGLSESQQKLARSLRKRLKGLDLPDETLAAFVLDDEEHDGRFTKDRASQPHCQRFLLSTDLFPSGDASRPLRYVAYYDPYVTPCRNPLAPVDTASSKG